MKLKVNCDSEGIREAVKAVCDGKVIIFPTDTVYGMGCDPFNAKAVKEIFQIKQRNTSKPLPVLGYSKNELEKIAVLDKSHKNMIEKFWPGPLTIITKIKDAKLKESMNLDEKIAVRVPENKCVLQVLKGCKLLVGTSANMSGQKPFVNSNECFAQFKDIPVFVDGGDITSFGESTIIEIQGDDLRIIRQGKITKQELL